jgi:DNA-binding CsgD family transcriptional regulator
MAWTVADSQIALARLGGEPLEAAEFSEEVGAAIGGVLNFDGWCLFGTDPTTGLRTSQFGGRGTGHTAELARNEATMTDVNNYAALARSATPAGVLSPEHPLARRSFRLHEVLIPVGFQSEVRLVLRDHGQMWGALVLFRESGRRPFGADDLSTLRAIAPPLTRAMRTLPVRPLPRCVPSLPGGVVALAPNDRIVASSSEAQAWLNDLLTGGDDQTTSSNVLRVVYEAAHAVRRGDTGRSATCLRTVSGRWLRLEATSLRLGEADVVVMLQPATPEQLLSTFKASEGLTPRESQMFALLVEGLAAKQIARRLGISLLTVNEHVRSLYRKCGVTGRAELIARLT